MSAQILEAIQLANAGQREAAREILRQVVTVETGNEMAWLWLASVAEDQNEYRVALKEVLRINPANDQAKVLLTQVTPAPAAPPSDLGEGMTYVPTSPPYGVPQQPVSPAHGVQPPWGAPQPPISPAQGVQQRPMSPPYGVPQQPVSPAHGVQPPWGAPQQPVSPAQGVPQRPMSPPYGVPQQPVSPAQGVPQRPMSPPYGVAQQPVSPAQGIPQQRPMSPPYGVAQQPVSPAQGIPQQRVQSAYAPAVQAQPQVRQRPVRVRSCLLMLAIFVVLPLGVFLGLCYSGKSLGSLDLIASYLPGDFGRKTITFELPSEAGGTSTVSVKVPRSWYVAHNKETWWDAWQGFLDEYMKFDAGYGPFDDSWADVEAHYETATADDGAVYIVETNPLHLKADGAPTLLIYAGMGTATPERTQCSEMADSSLERLELHDGLCAGWSVRAEEYMGASILDGSEMPSQFYTVGLSIPLDDQTITRWIIAVPGERYASIESYIETLIQSVKVE